MYLVASVRLSVRLFVFGPVRPSVLLSVCVYTTNTLQVIIQCSVSVWVGGAVDIGSRLADCSKKSRHHKMTTTMKLNRYSMVTP